MNGGANHYDNLDEETKDFESFDMESTNSS